MMYTAEREELQRVSARYASWTRAELAEELNARCRDVFDDETDDDLRLRLAQDDTGLEPCVMVVSS